MDGTGQARIVVCDDCGAQNRIGPHAKDLRPVCGRCGSRLRDPANDDCMFQGTCHNHQVASTSIVNLHGKLKRGLIAALGAGLLICVVVLVTSTRRPNGTRPQRDEPETPIVLYEGNSNSLTEGTLYLLDSCSIRRAVDPSAGTVIISMASWCPASVRFNDLLQEPAVRDAFSHLRIIYVYSDEWPSVKRMLKDLEPSITNEVLEGRIMEMRRSSGFASVFDPSRLAEAAGEVLFATETVRTTIKATPMVFNPATSEFDTNAISWAVEILSEKMPEGEFRATLGTHFPELFI